MIKWFEVGLGRGGSWVRVEVLGGKGVRGFSGFVLFELYLGCVLVGVCFDIRGWVYRERIRCGFVEVLGEWG